MNFLITGGSGFIGSRLSHMLLDNGQSVTVLTRNKNKAARLLPTQINLIDTLEHAGDYDVIINLAGESLATGRWTQARKQQLYTSRLNTTEELIKLISRSKKKPDLLLSGSAIGFYGSSDTAIFTEDSAPADHGFTHDLCDKWEKKAYLARQYDVRVCVLRTGLVLGAGGGVLAKMLPAFNLGLGGKMGSGEHWMSWVHMDDLLGVITHIIENKNIDGAVNATSPNPVTNKEFTQALGQIMGRPSCFTTPAALLKLIFGEMAETLLLQGQKVLPQKIMAADYQFKHERITDAFRQVL